MAKVSNPQYCPHCGKSIAQVRPVGPATLSVALAILRGAQTSNEVSAALGIAKNAARMRLIDAEDAGLIRADHRISGAKGGSIKVYAPCQRLRSYALAEYDRRFKRRKVIHDIAS